MQFNRFLKALRLKQKENYVVDSIADIMVEFFSTKAEKLISAYGKMICETNELNWCMKKKIVFHFFIIFPSSN